MTYYYLVKYIVILSATCIPNGNFYIEKFYPGGQDHVTRNFGAMSAYAVGSLIVTMFMFKLRGLRNLH